ncbi:MAG: hypothetical protein H7066_00705 [Cytophagaceae bacterium]|nr:hypothetical protein [Gemmatimonadaceae bacterium]
MLGIPLALVQAALGGAQWLFIALYAIVPIVVVSALCHWVAKRSGEMDRILVVWTLLLAALAWLVYLTVSASLLVLAVLVAVLPRVGWWRWVPLAWGWWVLAATVVHPVLGWTLDAEFIGETWPALVHVALLVWLVGFFAWIRGGPTSSHFDEFRARR